jgi:hypothetical protein
MRSFVRLALVLAVLSASLIGGEAFSRYGLGLGDPPLTIIDNEIEYLFAPSRSYSRFGNVISYNSKSMRATEIPLEKKPGDIRVIIIGDSVVNGGALIDQRNIASELLREKLGSHAWVGNISAGSWGPANMLAYVRRYGFFNADAAIIIVSTHDLEDLPEFRQHYGVDFPEEPPSFALTELVTRYLPKYFPALTSYLVQGSSPATVTYSDEERLQKGEAALQGLIDFTQQHVHEVTVVIHPTKNEIGDLADVNIKKREQLKRVLEATHVRFIDPVNSQLWNISLYRDNIHLNERGHAVYARIFECLLKQVQICQ